MNIITKLAITTLLSMTVFSTVVSAANRSYLYSFNQNNQGKVSKIFDISEQNYDIPIIYKILVSGNTKIIPSKVFENSNALIGDAKEGRKRLDRFFERLI